MALTASLYLLELKDLQSLQENPGSDSKAQKLIARTKKILKPSINRLERLAVEKVKFRWSGTAFVVLAVFSNQKLQLNWDQLKYSSLANAVSKNWEAGVYIFSLQDEGLSRLQLNGLPYSRQELDEFAIEFTGEKPVNTDIMKDAVELLNQTLLKLTSERVVLLLMRDL